jgi:acetyltransferase-like isoleucine patch superfamily enzyme
MKTKDKVFYRLRERVQTLVVGMIRNLYWKIQGVECGKNTILKSCDMTWPHKVKIGSNCILESGVSFKYDGIWSESRSIIIGDDCFIGFGCEFNIRKSINIGKDCLIASGCKFIDHEHGFENINIPMRTQNSGKEAPIEIKENVWLGVNVVVLKGVKIHKGAIVAAGAVVTKSIPENEIWGGVPARKMSSRV